MKASALTRTNALAALLVISLQLPSFAANQTLHVSPQGNDAWSGRLADANRNQTVTDNHFHTLGRIYPPAIGIFILQSGTNRAAHNHIHDLYYTAVSVG